MGRHATRPRTCLRWIAIAAVLGALLIPAIRPTSAADESEVRVVLGDTELDPAEAADFHCHDRDLPTITCFATSDERDDDLSAGDSGSTLLADPYVALFEDEGYGGASYVAYNPFSDLGVIGWNDMITSFKSLNGQRPRLYADEG